MSEQLMIVLGIGKATTAWDEKEWRSEKSRE